MSDARFAIELRNPAAMEFDACRQAMLVALHRLAATHPEIARIEAGATERAMRQLIEAVDG